MGGIWRSRLAPGRMMPSEHAEEAIDGSQRDLETRAGYRRALVIVVLLNGGYGLIETAGGFLADSQSLKADALDFVGDGVITLMGLLAFAWSAVWRARIALVQGLFLAVLGVGVLTSTVMQIVEQQEPEAELMGLFGVAGLAVNLSAALVLLRYREGDANMRAVWLFSRNDALGNIAVVIAALFVAVTSSGWPDIVVALVIAALFLQSAYEITRAAMREMDQSGR